MTHPRIALLGQGAVGATLVRALYLGKVPFDILLREESRVRELAAQPITYTLGKRTTTIPLGPQGPGRPVLLTAADKGYDLVFLGMKSMHLRASLALVKPLLAPGGRAVLLQNGLPEDDALQSIEPAQLAGGVVGWNVQTKAPQT